MRRLGRLVRFGAVGLVLVVSPAALAQELDPVAEELRQRVERLRSDGALEVAGERVASVSVLPDLYDRRGDRPAWTNPAAIEDLLAAVRGAEEHGLEPEDYHRAALERLRSRVASGGADADTLADFDLLLSDALLRLGYHAIFGKVDPVALDNHWNLDRDIGGRDPAVGMQRVIDSVGIRTRLRELIPSHPAYARFLGALARYRGIAARGGWEPVPEGPKLEKGSEGPRVEALRRRLAASGDLAAEAGAGTSFDAEVALPAVGSSLAPMTG